MAGPLPYNPGYPMSDDESLPEPLAGIAARMAIEGIPVRAMARCIQATSEVIRETLREAKGRGQIVDIPKDDWPAGQSKEERLPVKLRTMTDDDLRNACMKTFRITQLEGTVLIVLLRRDEATKDMIHGAIEHRRATRAAQPETMEETDPKMVDVVICKLRKKLRPFDVVIVTMWSRGYFMEKAMRKKAYDLIADAVGR